MRGAEAAFLSAGAIAARGDAGSAAGYIAGELATHDQSASFGSQTGDMQEGGGGRVSYE